MIKKKLLKNRLGLIIGIIFVILTLFVIMNRGNLPGIFTKEGDTSCRGDVCSPTAELTFLGKVLIFVVFPYSAIALALEGILPDLLFFSLVLLAEFVYGFVIGDIIFGLKKLLLEILER